MGAPLLFEMLLYARRAKHLRHTFRFGGRWLACVLVE